MIDQPIELSLFDDRMRLAGPAEPIDIPLAYQIHARLIQTGELAHLLAEHLREEGADRLPPAGSRIRLILPREWGLVTLRLPYVGLGGLKQPLHHLAWEVDCNAPDASEQYFFDYQEIEEPSTAGETRVLAVRQNLVAFCRTLCEDLDWRLVELAPAGDEGVFRLDLARAQAHREGLTQERFAPGRPWLRIALGAAAVLLLAGAATWITARRAVIGDWLADQAGPATAPQKTVPAVVPPLPPATRAAAPPDWLALVDSLAAREDGLPDFLALDAEGLLAQAGAPARDASGWTGRPARVVRRGSGSVWWRFETPLAGGLVPEDPARPVARFNLGDLDELPARLDGAPARLILERRRGDSTGVPNGKSPGWRVTLLPGQPPDTAKTSR